jgi:hypothetical protein
MIRSVKHVSCHHDDVPHFTQCHMLNPTNRISQGWIF